jgi:hypothetical protein
MPGLWSYITNPSARGHARKFKSDEMAEGWVMAKHKISRKPKVKQCTECDVDFIPGHMGQVQCSLKCAKAAKLRAPASVKDKTQKPLRRSVRKAKKKTKTVHQLIEKAAELLQKIRRLEEADENGYCKCVSTGEKRHWKEMQGGHWIPRGRQEPSFVRGISIPKPREPITRQTPLQLTNMPPG